MTEHKSTNLKTGEGIHRGALANLFQELGRVPVTRRMHEELSEEQRAKLAPYSITPRLEVYDPEFLLGPEDPVGSEGNSVAPVLQLRKDN